MENSVFGDANLTACLQKKEVLLLGIASNCKHFRLGAHICRFPNFRFCVKNTAKNVKYERMIKLNTENPHHYFSRVLSHFRRRMLFPNIKGYTHFLFQFLIYISFENKMRNHKEIQGLNGKWAPCIRLVALIRTKAEK